MIRNTASQPDSGAEEVGVKSIARAARLLQALSGTGPDGGMLSEIARQSELGKATTHRLLAALIDAGFVFQDPATRRYRLGAGLAAIGHKAHQQDFASLAQPFIDRIAEATEDTVYASVREGVAAVCVGRAIGAFPIRTLSLDVGHRRPLGVGSGSLAMLAFLPEDEVDQVVRKNEEWLKTFSAIDRDVLMRLVKRTREQGHSFVEGLILPGMFAIGMPVYDAVGRPFAALSMSAIADRMQPRRIAELVALLKSEARELERAAALGSEPPARSSKRKSPQ